MPTRADVETNPAGLLTQRERECLRLVDQHLSSKQIARELGMSKTSVDTYCDRARRKLGVPDRYEAARLLRRHDGDPVLTGSGQDAIRTDNPAARWLDDPATEGTAHGRPAELRQSASDRQGAAPAPGDRRLRGALAGSGPQGGEPSGLLLDPAGTAARRPVGDARPGGHGAAPGVRHAEAGAVQAGRNGPAGDPLHDLGPAGRELPAGRGRWLGPNELGPAARLGAIVAVAILTALAFGGMLAGLHALQALAVNLT
ncbi:transcriptional regulator, LuxR family [Phenylobacterium zucineum HLK1]|uniref:Transcriptional regulator, LuxR family n=1 Tax=Phenylobacterium zucineum (strain HLK1) TaxID=450851 RepID=B4RC99_PHEZH|nr:transcriptional regulator, LuxR family [Phenylobacterium zucineum HLK1]